MGQAWKEEGRGLCTQTPSLQACLTSGGRSAEQGELDGLGGRAGGQAGRVGRKLTSVTLTTPICGADRSMSNVFSQ